MALARPLAFVGAVGAATVSEGRFVMVGGNETGSGNGAPVVVAMVGLVVGGGAAVDGASDDGAVVKDTGDKVAFGDGLGVAAIVGTIGVADIVVGASGALVVVVLGVVVTIGAAALVPLKRGSGIVVVLLLLLVTFALAAAVAVVVALLLVLAAGGLEELLLH
jgi:hypothetical protein